MTELIWYLNGEYVPEGQVRIHPLDRGFMVGDTVFDVERTFNGKIFRLKEHLERLYRSLKYVRTDPGLTLEEMAEVTEEVVRRNEPMREPGGDFSVRQFVTRGLGGPTGVPMVCVMVTPISFGRYARFYETGAPVVIPKVRSYSTDSLDSKIKHYSRMNFAMAQMEAEDVDPDAYAVLLDQQGNISENIGGNFIIVTNGVIQTPPDQSILQGISRMTVIDLAKQLGIPVVEGDLQPYDAYNADEAFLVTTSYCVLPVATVDNRRVGHEVPGPITKRLLAAWSEQAGLDIVDQALEWDKRHRSD